MKFTRDNVAVVGLYVDDVGVGNISRYEYNFVFGTKCDLLYVIYSWTLFYVCE